MDEEKSDKLIARLRKGDAGKVSFSVSNDYKYLILSGIRMVCIANIENLDQKLKFKLIFEKSQNAAYVSAHVCSIFRKSFDIENNFLFQFRSMSEMMEIFLYF